MAAGLTDHVWTTDELLAYRVPVEFLNQLRTIEPSNTCFQNGMECITATEGHYQYLPSYSPELNLIEILWRFIKYYWLLRIDTLNRKALANQC
jgi:hypothetical protein